LLQVWREWAVHADLETPVKPHIKIVWCAMIVVAAFLSAGCYVTQDASGHWWACEDYATANGPLTGCTPIEWPLDALLP
jgi:hypothetical protein